MQRLGELGWVEGRSIVIDYRPTEGLVERAGEIAAEFVRLKVDVIVTGGDAQALAAKRATTVIPIVFGAAGDPVGNGLVQALARPGGNVTGSSVQLTDTAGKRLEILREIVPDLRRLAISGNFPNSPQSLRRCRQQLARWVSTSSARNSDVRGYSAGDRKGHRPRASALHLCRPARAYQRGSHQCAGFGGATAGHS